MADMSSFQTVRWHANNSVFPQRAVRFAPPAFCLFTAIQVRKGSGRESVRCLFELVSSGCDYNFLNRLIDVFIRIGYNKRSRNGKAASQIWFSIIKKERRRLLFHQIFNPENGFFSSISKFMDIVGLSVVWLIACLPVITIGPATAALYYSVVKCVRRDEKHPYRNFWRSFQTNWKMGSLLTLLCLPAGIFLYWEHGMLRTLASGGDKVLMGSYIAMTLLLLLPIGFLCWLLPLLSRFESSLGGLLWNAFLLTFRYLPVSIALALLIFLSVTLTTALWFFLLFAVTPAVTALLASFPVERVLKKCTCTDSFQENEDKPWYLK